MEVEVLLELFVTQFIAIFELSVRVRVLLNSIICKVNVLVLYILKGKLFACSSNVSILVPVSTNVAIY
jgi:hypothetical protein